MTGSQHDTTTHPYCAGCWLISLFILLKAIKGGITESRGHCDCCGTCTNEDLCSCHRRKKWHWWWYRVHVVNRGVFKLKPEATFVLFGDAGYSYWCSLLFDGGLHTLRWPLLPILVILIMFPRFPHAKWKWENNLLSFYHRTHTNTYATYVCVLCANLLFVQVYSSKLHWKDSQLWNCQATQPTWFSVSQYSMHSKYFQETCCWLGAWTF